MLTSNVPFTYAVKTSGGMLHLYIVIYSGDTGPGYPNAGTLIGNTWSFTITPGNEGTKPYPKHYSINAGAITNININFTFNQIIRLKKIEDFDIENQPVQSGDTALDVPYGFTQKIDENHFKGELAVFSATAKKFRCIPRGPATGTKDTFSEIDLNGANATTAFKHSNEFEVTDFMTPPNSGFYEISTGGPPKKRTRTKNINVTAVPFPTRRQ